jgi:hypothetical protein
MRRGSIKALLSEKRRSLAGRKGKRGSIVPCMRTVGRKRLCQRKKQEREKEEENQKENRKQTRTKKQGRTIQLVGKGKERKEWWDSPRREARSE